MSLGRSTRDKFIHVSGSPLIGSLITSREYEKSARTPFFSKFNFVFIYWILIANGEGELSFACRASCSGVMKLKTGFCSKLFTL